MKRYFLNFLGNYHTIDKLWITLLFSCFVSISGAQNYFIQTQKRHPRVQTAFEKVESDLRERFRKQGLNYPPQDIYFRVFKKDGTLEIWVKEYPLYASEPHYILFDAYEICKGSGDIGPKVKEGDLQVPEGFYYINKFNPSSSFHLSLGINYPNKADRERNKGEINLGGDIFVHGSCVTVGCIPLTNSKIEEVYVLSVLAKSNGQVNIPVHIFPFRFTVSNESLYFDKFPEHVNFWSNLKFFYHYFELKRNLPNYTIDRVGNYTVLRN